MEKFAITINRYCGSGGSFIGRKLAQKLGVSFYDRELIDLASDESGINKQLFAQADERVKNSLFKRMATNVYDGNLITPDSEDFTSYQNLFNYQAKVIRDIAQRESCIIVGRCADFVLRGTPNLVRVFVGATEEKCVKEEMDRLDLTNKEAKERVTKTDMYRKAYYRYYTGQRWNSAKHYDICLNTTVLTYDDCADIIIEFLNKLMEKAVD